MTCPKLRDRDPGQIVTDMFMQFIIECVRRIAHQKVTVYLYFWRVHYFKFEYLDTLIAPSLEWFRDRRWRLGCFVLQFFSERDLE
jgi:hypothetical protein